MAEPHPLDHMKLSRSGSGLWIAEADSAAQGHALGLVVAQPPPSPQAIALPFKPVVRDGLMAYVTEAELGLSTLGKSGIAEILAGLPSELTFMNLATLLTRIALIRMDARAQLELARQIYEDAPVMEAF